MVNARTMLAFGPSSAAFYGVSLPASVMLLIYIANVTRMIPNMSYYTLYQIFKIYFICSIIIIMGGCTYLNTCPPVQIRVSLSFSGVITVCAVEAITAPLPE